MSLFTNLSNLFSNIGQYFKGLFESFSSQDKNTNGRGFTLIELLITVAIIAILSVVGVAVYNNVSVSTRDVKRKADLKIISSALQRYYLANGVMPNNPTPGNACRLNTTPGCLSELITGSFIQNLPEDPLGASGPGYNYYNYGPGNNKGAMIAGNLEGIAATSIAPPGSCRPFDTLNWCSTFTASTYFCFCVPH